MILSPLTLPEEMNIPAVPDSIFSSPYLTLGLQAWMPELYQWRPIGRLVATSLDGQQPVIFEIDTIDLPTATRRWKVSSPEHPGMTFDDLRAGKWPEPTEEEIKARSKALELAQHVHDKLDIRPLTTATVVRQLREGKEDRD
jgi:hypothetical protein